MNCILLDSHGDSTVFGWEFWLPVLISLVGSGAALIWNLFQQRKIQSLQGEIEKKLLVHRLQFETEFNAYVEIWESLILLSRELYSFRPELDAARVDKNVLSERAKNIRDLGNNAIVIISKTEPFYPSNINKQLNTVLRLFKEEFHSAQILEDDYWKGKQKRIDAIIKSINDARDSIRKRVGTN